MGHSSIQATPTVGEQGSRLTAGASPLTRPTPPGDTPCASAPTQRIQGILLGMQRGLERRLQLGHVTAGAKAAKTCGRRPAVSLSGQRLSRFVSLPGQTRRHFPGWGVLWARRSPPVEEYPECIPVSHPSRNPGSTEWGTTSCVPPFQVCETPIMSRGDTRGISIIPWQARTGVARHCFRYCHLGKIGV